MCGIAGILAVDGRERIDAAGLLRMRDVLSHRGPDDRGLYLGGRVGFAHRRLSIIDLASGRQPMCSEDGRVWITYNGEIYNFRQLRERLAAQGVRFRTNSDTEVLLRAYERYGEDCVDHLRGMFAFAIWDGHRDRLFLARDRLGIKPLYYLYTGRLLLFASEIKALLAAGVARPQLNVAALPEYLANRYIAGEETFYCGIRKLLPAHVLTWSAREGLRRRRYWCLPAPDEGGAQTMSGYAREIRLRLEEAVDAHLVSDVPLGVLLSGGMDSSGLAGLVARMRREPVKTFSVGFEESRFSELKWARLAAEASQTEHHEAVVGAADFFGHLPRLVWHEDEPIAFPSSVPLYFISELARRHVKVILTGEGADELFLGYERYRVTAWNMRLSAPYSALVPRAVRRGVGRLVRGLPEALSRYGRRSFLALPGGIRSLFYENFSVFAPELQERLLAAAGGTTERDPYGEAMHAFEGAPGSLLERMSAADLQTYLVELLMKQDQMSMAASLESRVPFLDHRFVEYVATIPGRYKLSGWRTKAVLRRALSDVTPAAIVRRRKMGFPTPLPVWLRGRFAPFASELVAGPRARARGLFNADEQRRLVEEHRRGERNNADRLWLLMNLEIWQRIFIDGEDPESVAASAMPRSDSSHAMRPIAAGLHEADSAAAVGSAPVR